MEPTVYVANTDYMKVATNYGNKMYKWRLLKQRKHADETLR